VIILKTNKYLVLSDKSSEISQQGNIVSQEKKVVMKYFEGDLKQMILNMNHLEEKKKNGLKLIF